MDDYQEEEIPKHKKRATKRPWKIVWTYIGPKTFTRTNVKTGEKTVELIENDFFYRSMAQPWTQRYRTEKAARQALEAWQDGKTMTWKKRTHWKAEMVRDAA